MSSPRPPAFPTYLTVEEVADILRMSKYQIIELCRSGELRATRPRKSWRIEEQAVRDLIDSSANYKAAS